MAEKTVKVLYKGPCDKVIVAPYGDHYKDTEKEYPEDFAGELIETSNTQQFSIVKPSGGDQKDKDENPGKAKKEVGVGVIMLADHSIGKTKYKAGDKAVFKPEYAEKLIKSGKAKKPDPDWEPNADNSESEPVK